MPFTVSPAPYSHQSYTISEIMRQVLYALIPAILLIFIFYGWGIFWQLLLTCTAALVTEVVMLHLRKRPIKAFVSDNSALLSACLLAVAIPPLAPWWISVLGISFALIFAKHLYGGLGYNSFNPTMVGYAMLLISFPVEMTQWQVADANGTVFYAGFMESFQIIFNNLQVDGLSGATTLDVMKNHLNESWMLSEIVQLPGFGLVGGQEQEWISLALLLGGIWLVYRKIIGWQIPVALLGSLFVIASLFHVLYLDSMPSPLFHLFSGATMLGAFFIATDPITAATSNRGKLYYAAGIGLLIYIIRSWGGYPDGVAFAVLLMNMAVPTLDYYTQPPVFGAENRD
ncbi:RnfABCDGE type electron transport complex subunit D [Candidatus Venteria ishoeyi]|uniref:RnfABCDGE type electron transport complex subunit D n=1 Tax=Candidatus Venteria ishoeyi TaxID=1899563 RepID=UPI0025A5E8AC|nr:RnfABCDGE type electron transport complex subunit D [Candidatus Venteria ishoeyi]MDM8546631.1 RnfABCDGE type electron transport complex subunit D [Candidatus Venteria ishoeyi]